MRPSQHLANCQARFAEIEEHAAYHREYAADFKATTYRETAHAYAALADAENRERIREQKEAATVSYALGVLDLASPDSFSDGQIARICSLLLDKMGDRTTPVAWAGSGIGMRQIVADLMSELAEACRNDGIQIGAGAAMQYAEEARRFDSTEAQSINADMRRAA